MSAQAGSGTVLDRILEARRLEVDHRKRVLPEAALRYGVNAARPLRDFPAALTRDSLNIIAELKPASPSKGILRDPFHPVELAQSLEVAGAAVLSVLTEGEFLLIVAALQDELLRDLIALGRQLKMDPLVEVHTAAELERALAAEARIIGVNNRDLKTLDLRVETSFELIERIPDSCIAVSESGLRTHDDLAKLRAAGFDAFLIGESLMLSPDPAAALGTFLGRSALPV